jgi:hypothetical protein
VIGQQRGSSIARSALARGIDRFAALRRGHTPRHDLARPERTRA